MLKLDHLLRAVRRPVEYAAARLALAVIPRLSRPSLLALSRFLGSTIYLLLGRLRKIALANLQVALPAESPAQHRAHLKRSMQVAALTLLDSFWLVRHGAARLRGLVEFDPSYQERIFKPGPLICLTAHMGNWEVLGLGVSQQGYPLTSVTAPIKNSRVDALFNSLRNQTGQKTVSKKGAVRTLLKTLRDQGKIALVLDQNVKPAHGGVFVDFFGLPAAFSAAAAQLSLRTGAPLLIGVCVPNDRGTYTTPPLIEIDRTRLPDEEEAAVRELTQRIAHGIETIIRNHPDHWLWTYKRWKIRPEGTDPAAYPFYTRLVRPRDLPGANRP